MKPRRRKPLEGQITFMPEPCPESGDLTGESIGLEYDRKAGLTYECWVCSCGFKIRFLVSGNLA